MMKILQTQSHFDRYYREPLIRNLKKKPDKPGLIVSAKENIYTGIQSHFDSYSRDTKLKIVLIHKVALIDIMRSLN